MDNSRPVLDAKIISAGEDRFWEDRDGILASLTPCNVLVVAAEPVDEAMIERLVARCGSKPGEYAVVRVSAAGAPAWRQLQAAVIPQVVILLGVLPADLGVHALFVFCEPNRFGGALWLPGPSCAQMNGEVALRKQFWDKALAPAFGK
jgi:hypothetical protein